LPYSQVASNLSAHARLGDLEAAVFFHSSSSSSSKSSQAWDTKFNTHIYDNNNIIIIIKTTMMDRIILFYFSFIP
jgi:hypothetical protein